MCTQHRKVRCRTDCCFTYHTSLMTRNDWCHTTRTSKTWLRTSCRWRPFTTCAATTRKPSTSTNAFYWTIGQLHDNHWADWRPLMAFSTNWPYLYVFIVCDFGCLHPGFFCFQCLPFSHSSVTRYTNYFKSYNYFTICHEALPKKFIVYYKVCEN